MLNPSNAHELAQIAREAGALVLRSPLPYPDSDWAIGPEVLSEYLYQLRDRQVLVILATVDGEPVHLCGVCGFPLHESGEPCPRCALLDEEVGAALDGRRVAGSVEEWLKEKQPHLLEAEIARLQATIDALEACPPLWWADKLLWRGLRWFYKMRLQRVKAAWEQHAEGD